jgi:sigma-B regulation protein RsbU (phosphoserine phosphatase)
VTVSLGVAQFEPTDDSHSLFNRADRRLYRAKRGGRNQVVPAAAA